MKLFKAATTVCCLAVMSAVLAPGAKADDWNRKTSDHLQRSRGDSGRSPQGWGVLPAGTYVFKILDSQSDRHIVQIFNRMKTVYATILAIPNYRLQSHRQDRDHIQRKTRRRAGSAARLVLSGQELGRGIRLSESQSDRAGQGHQHARPLHAGRTPARSRRADQVGGRACRRRN